MGWVQSQLQGPWLEGWPEGTGVQSWHSHPSVRLSCVPAGAQLILEQFLTCSAPSQYTGAHAMLLRVKFSDNERTSRYLTNIVCYAKTKEPCHTTQQFEPARNVDHMAIVSWYHNLPSVMATKEYHYISITASKNSTRSCYEELRNKWTRLAGNCRQTANRIASS